MFLVIKTWPIVMIVVVIMGSLFLRNRNKKMFGYILSQADVAECLAQINPTLAAEARKVLDVNKSERHIRGGMATKEKYLHMEQKGNWNDGRNGSPICGFLKRGRPEMLATSSNMSDQLW